MIDLSQLQRFIHHENGVSRRLFLAYAAGLSSLPLLGRRVAGQTGKPTFPSDPFRLGVASGDPDDRSVVLWTRLAPRPLEPAGGLPPENYEVAWELAHDDNFRDVVQRGMAMATPQLAHSVHVEARGLQADRWYWYRFRAGDATSPVGRTRTLPAPAAQPREMRFAFASCQNYTGGLYTAYEHMARDELDLVFHLGDYIYEGASEPGDFRQHVGGETVSLGDYRVRHALYRSEQPLQAAHAHCPWVVTWDDHEFDNDYANDISEESWVKPAEFLVRRAAAYQAYYEHMPLRAASLPKGPDMQLYRGLAFGQLASFCVLDTRQFRTDQPADYDYGAQPLPRGGTIMGPKQLDWLQTSLAGSPATWNVLPQQVMLAVVDLEPGERVRYSMDKWAGYADERQALIEFMADRKIRNPIVLTGDIHSNWVNELRVDDRRPDLPVVATEFVGTSISSDGNGEDRPKGWEKVFAENPGVRFFNRQRGYVRCTLTRDTLRSDYQVVPDILQPGGAVHTRASFVVEAGRPGVHEA